MSYDLVIKNANIVDGSGSQAQRGSVAVAGRKIVALEKALSGGKREIDAHGLTLAPGFIDIHTHFDAQISWDPLLTPTCWHGVTSVLMGNCGVGVAPCRPSERSVMAWDLVNVEAMPHDERGRDRDDDGIAARGDRGGSLRLLVEPGEATYRIPGTPARQPAR